jgi:hypothetical protein
MKVNEARVRELAYQIWESEGRPDGQEERHWRMARSLAEAEAANQGEGEESVPPRFTGDNEPEKPAILQEPPRRKGRLPKADPELPGETEEPGETVAPTPPPAERRSAPKAKPTKSAPTVTPTSQQRKSKPSAAEQATPTPPAKRRPGTPKPQSV